jgi:hypothetical protein
MIESIRKISDIGTNLIMKRKCKIMEIKTSRKQKAIRLAESEQKYYSLKSVKHKKHLEFLL